jgi:hypothetical protein
VKSESGRKVSVVEESGVEFVSPSEIEEIEGEAKEAEDEIG